MKILITGKNGTLGQVLAQNLESIGHQVEGWDRHHASPLSLDTHSAYLDEIKPDAIFHLAIAAESTGAQNEGWRINVEWSEHLASLCAQRQITFIFTSTALVFNNDVSGPFTTTSLANAHEGYGFEKRIAEERVRAVNPDARIVRLGWQIGNNSQGNQMLAYISKQQHEYDQVGASTRWYPACSFLPDTAAALASLLDKPAGLYMADSNPGYTFFEILCALKAQSGLDWVITPNEDYVYNQRLIDPDLPLPSLNQRLSALPTRS